MGRSTLTIITAALIAVSISSNAAGASPLHLDAPVGDKPDPQIAAQMSLASAKSAIQRWARQKSNASVYGEATFEFTAERIVITSWAAPGPQPGLRICPYETFDPLAASDTSSGLIRAFTNDHTGEGCSYLYVAAPTRDIALQVAAAMLRWKNSTLAERQAFLAGGQEAFAPVVAAYSASNPRPQIPEDVHRSFVMAQAAIQDKRFPDAVDDFEDGLKLAPWWPEGHFNAAIILGELHYYDEAIDHMKKYIALVPDAPNARAAQDKIYVWEGEQSAAAQ